MRMVLLLFKISILYWCVHKKRLITFMATLIMGVAALYSAAALIRSEKNALLEEELRRLGEYDMVLYHVPAGGETTLQEIPQITDSGSYTDLGYAEGKGNQYRAKLACFADTASEKMYHMTCTQGHYPRKGNEIAIDANTAKRMGVKPEVGQKVNVTLYDENEKKLRETEFHIVGVFEGSDQSVYGGWLRYPDSMELSAYEMPGIFVSESLCRDFLQNSQCVFLQTNGSCDKLQQKIYKKYKGKLQYEDIVIPSGRRYAYSYILGIADQIYTKYGSVSLENILDALKQGDVIRDFYSGVLVPIFGGMVFLTVFFSVVGVIGSIMNDKREQCAIFKIVGMEGKMIGIWYFADFLCLSAVAAGLGVLLGWGIHIVMIWCMNHFLGMRLAAASYAGAYVRSVTQDPVRFAVEVVLTCFVVASIVPIVRYVRTRPLVLLRPAQTVRRQRRSKDTGHSRKLSWSRLVQEHMVVRSGSILLAFVLMMGVAVFGFTYFSALSALNTSELALERKQAGLQNYDYTVKRSQDIGMYAFHIENHHEDGIAREIYENLSKKKYVKRIQASMVNRSMRLVYEKGDIAAEKQKYLSQWDMRSAPATTDFEQDLVDAEDEMLAGIGYSKGEEIYQVTGVGLPEQDLMQWKNKVVAGTIDVEKIQRGEEMILAVSEDQVQEALKYFQPGEALPLSDIVLDEVEDAYDFNHFNPGELLEPAYRKNVTTDDGNEVTLSSYAIGKRKDIATVVGAVVVYTKKDTVLPNRKKKGMYVLCGLDTFEAWGLPDQLLTSMKLKVKEGTDLDAADEDWYREISGCQGVSVQSAKEILDKAQRTQRQNMCVYYMMMVLLFAQGLIAATVAFYNRMSLKGQEFAYLKLVGLSDIRIFLLAWKQNMLYPLAGALFSICPVAVCQMFFYYIRHQIDQGIWQGTMEITGSEQIPWYHYVPFRYDLFSYSVEWVVAVVFVLFCINAVLISLPGLRHIRAQKLAEELEINTY